MSRTVALAFLAVASALVFAACGGGGGGGGTPTARPTGTTAAQCTGALAGLTYANYAKNLFDTTCIGCHDGAGSQGAPISTNFTTYQGVLDHIDHIDEAAGANPDGSVVNTFMPRFGTLPLLDRQKLSCWIATGAAQ